VRATVAISRDKKKIMDYSGFQSALLVGEADFSFTAAFAKEPSFRGSITATEYSSAFDILNLYYPSETSHNAFPAVVPSFLVELLKTPNVSHIMASVDAKQLANVDTCLCEPLIRTQQEGYTLFGAAQPFWTIVQDQRPFDLVIFNCPHTDQWGKAPRLLKFFFAQLRQCILNDSMSMMTSDLVVELRLRDLTRLSARKVRMSYQHEEAAYAANFRLLGVYPNDNKHWEALGYEHKQTKRNVSCRNLPCQVWRWHYDCTTATAEAATKDGKRV